jgi:glutathione transport system substrate-binding protein
VRQALNYAINKDAMVKAIYYGHAVPLAGPVPASIQFGVKLPAYPFDLAKARKLLAEAGYPNGFETELWGANTSTAEKAMQFLQQQFSQVGVRVKITPQEAGQRVEMLENAPKPEEAKVRLNLAGWSSSTGEADWALRPLFATSAFPPHGMYNFAYYSNAKVDNLLNQALGTTRVQDKAAMYKEAQEIITQDAPWVFLTNPMVAFARTRNLTGAYVMPDGSMNFEEAAFK